MSIKHIVLLDNFDSFTYNLVDELRCLDFDLSVYRNTADVNFIFDTLQARKEQSLLMLSPGPGSPEQAGNMMAIIEKVAGVVPVLGICLGHQAIIQHYGGDIIRAPQAIHGKSSAVQHVSNYGFQGLPNPLSVARYHSLVASNMPNNLMVTASYEDLPMAIVNEQEKMMGLQFHPESIMTAQGSQLLQQCIEYLS